ncbi:MAG: aquaporin [Spirochaetota bacterium]
MRPGRRHFAIHETRSRHGWTSFCPLKLHHKINRYVTGCIEIYFFAISGCCAIAVYSAYNGVFGHIRISVLFGLTVLMMRYAVGNIFAVYINPAITIGFILAR